MILRFAAILILFTVPLPSQRKVDPKYTYQRVICVVPMVGAGTAADPKRPQYAPPPPTTGNQPTSAIIGYSQQVSDDGKFALVEFVARDQSAFQAIRNDKTIKVFVKGKDKKEDIEAELKKYKKDFDFKQFGLVMP
jgi:hypothetical protein